MFSYEPGLISAHFLLFGPKNTGFHFQFISNAKKIFPKTLSSKHYGQVCLDRKVYQDLVIILFTATMSSITTATLAGE